MTTEFLLTWISLFAVKHICNISRSLNSEPGRLGLDRYSPVSFLPPLSFYYCRVEMFMLQFLTGFRILLWDCDRTRRLIDLIQRT